jgi:GNAT superfamily N-acetyltransferase
VAVHIRLRGDDDLDECVVLLEEVHGVDSYPTYWPEDPGRWLSPKAMLSAWVAERRGRIVGHIALGFATADRGAAVWSDATGLPPERLASITRLFVSLAGRGNGVGRALLDAACAEAAVRGLHPALDVVETNREAIRLYERCGWRRVFTEAWRSAQDGKTLLHYYVAPPSETGRPSER